jgi:hypothetical protein
MTAKTLPMMNHRRYAVGTMSHAGPTTAAKKRRKVKNVFLGASNAADTTSAAAMNNRIPEGMRLTRDSSSAPMVKSFHTTEAMQNRPDTPQKTITATMSRANRSIIEPSILRSYVGFGLFAVERKHLPDVDVARAGGWRDLATMKRSYQQPDPATTLRAIENQPDSESTSQAADASGSAR